MLEEKAALAALSLSTDELVKLRDAQVKNQESFVFAQREIEDSRVPSELDVATEKRSRLLKAHDTNAAQLSAFCGTPVVLATKAQGAAR
jgi:hypothetical protein